MSAVVHQEKVLRDETEVMRTYDDCDEVAFDLETTGANRAGLKPAVGSVAVVALSAPNRPPAVLHYPYYGPTPEIVEWLSKRVLVGHNVTAFDVPFMFKYGYDPLRSAGFKDTLVAEQLAIVAGRAGIKRDLQTSLKRRLGVEIDKSIDHSGWTRPELTEDQVRYAATDVSYVLRLLEAQEKVFEEYGTTATWQTEQEIAPVVSSMTARGFPLDDKMRLHYLDVAAGGLAALDDELRNLLGIGVDDVGSPKKIREAFERTLGVYLDSTDEATMISLGQQEGVVGRAAHVVLSCRKFKKRFMYDDDWCAEHVHLGRVHAQFWPMGTDTGRFAGKDPNLQQVPRDMRGMFGFDDEDDRVMVKADYSQIEVVAAAILSGESKLVEWATGGRDVHRMVASELFAVPEDAVEKEQRSIAKAGSFTLLFAGGVPSLVATAREGGNELSRDQARGFVRRFYRQFRAVEAYIAGVRNVVDFYNEKGLAYKLVIPHGPVRSLRGPRELKATRVVNSLVQGMAAAGMKRAIARTRRAGIAHLVRSTVHDELILEVERRDAEEAQDLLVECMVEGMREVLDVYVNVEASIGSHWS